jgi:hypothetical protein
MKNRIILALLLAVILALPAIAQENSSNAQNQPAAQTAAPKAENATAKNMYNGRLNPSGTESTNWTSLPRPIAS